MSGPLPGPSVTCLRRLPARCGSRAPVYRVTQASRIGELQYYRQVNRGEQPRPGPHRRPKEHGSRPTPVHAPAPAPLPLRLGSRPARLTSGSGSPKPHRWTIDAALSAPMVHRCGSRAGTGVPMFLVKPIVVGCPQPAPARRERWSLVVVGTATKDHLSPAGRAASAPGWLRAAVRGRAVRAAGRGRAGGPRGGEGRCGPRGGEGRCGPRGGEGRGGVPIWPCRSRLDTVPGPIYP